MNKTVKTLEEARELVKKNKDENRIIFVDRDYTPMNKQQTLERIIKQAYPDADFKVVWSDGENIKYIKIDDEFYYSIEELIFSPEFAKKFWGEELWYSQVDSGDQNNRTLLWQYHLQQLVLEEDRIQYLQQFLDE